jgi:hypothetical protein
MSILNSTIEPDVVSKLYKILLRTHRAVSHLPKLERYTLGEKLESALMDCLREVCLAAQEQKGFKTRPLLQALAHADLAKILLRMTHELEIISLAQYQLLGTELVEITSMLGGWLRFARTQ